MDAEALDLLRSIDASLKQLVAFANARRSASPASAGPVIADDRDLDSQWGDEVIKFEPRDWSGAPMKGRRMSECPVAFLEQLASTYDYFAQKNDRDKVTTDRGKPKSDFDKRSAARARGWAERLKAGKVPAPAAEPEPDSFGPGDFAADPAFDAAPMTLTADEIGF